MNPSFLKLIACIDLMFLVQSGTAFDGATKEKQEENRGRNWIDDLPGRTCTNIVQYNGRDYATMDCSPKDPPKPKPEGSEKAKCQTEWWKMPIGWSIPNFEEDICKNVVYSKNWKQYAWNTAWIVFADQRLCHTETGKEDTSPRDEGLLRIWESASGNKYKARGCDVKVLIHRKTRNLEDAEEGLEEQAEEDAGEDDQELVMEAARKKDIKF